MDQLACLKQLPDEILCHTRVSDGFIFTKWSNTIFKYEEAFNIECQLVDIVWEGCAYLLKMKVC